MKSLWNLHNFRLKTICTGLIIMFCISFFVSGCGMLASEPDTVTIDGQKYTTGFYGTLYPDNFECSEETYDVDDTEYRRIEDERFDLIHASIGFYESGTIFCKESQYEEAKEYYSDLNNYNYYCRIGEHDLDEPDFEPIVIDLSEADKEMLDALIVFGEENEFDPFNSFKNKEVQQVKFPFIPDSKTSPQLIFYKESKDGLFTSVKGSKFRVIEGKLYLIFFYDRNFGESEETVAVEVPDEMNDYILELLEQKEPSL